MQTVLSSLNSVPGVIGSMACDSEGRVLAQDFPASFETAQLTEAARVIADGAAGISLSGDQPELLDFRYGESRLLVKLLPGALLLTLCLAATNLKFLQLSISLSASKLAKLIESAAHTEAAATAPLPIPQMRAKREEAVEEEKSDPTRRKVAPPTKGLEELRKRLGQLGKK